MLKRVGMGVALVFILIGVVVVSHAVYSVGSVLLLMGQSPADTRMDLAFLRAARMQAIRDAQAQKAKQAQMVVPGPAEKP